MDYEKSLMGLVIAAVCVASGCFATTRYTNRADLHINSEPQGAKVYQGRGQYMGVTPLILNYNVDEDDRRSGFIRTQELIIIRDGYLPAKTQAMLQLKEERQRDIVPLDFGASDDYHDLTILVRDPNAPRVNYSVTDERISVRHEESGLDQALKTGELLLMLKTLSPNR